MAQQLSSHILLRGLGFARLDPGCGPMYHLSSHAMAGVPHIKKSKMGMDVSSGLIFLKKINKQKEIYLLYIHISMIFIKFF